MLYLLISILFLSLASVAEAQTCPYNEEYSDCSAPLCQNTCAEPTKSDNCNSGIVCEPGCKCIENYLRNSHGDCIHPDNCAACGPNEYYACGPPCDTECAFLNQPCPRNLPYCVERCYCEAGYARNKFGDCVPISQCKLSDKKCPANEELKWCPKPPDCPPETDCINKGTPSFPPCERPPVCYPRCLCKNGFIRKIPNGACIKPANCCPDANAVMVPTPNPCPGGTCKQPWFSNCNKTPKPYGCQCKKGFAKNSNGKCLKVPCVF